MNFAQHVGNDRFLVYAQEARSAWFAHLGYTDTDIDGLSTILADAAIQFTAEVFGGDELDVQLALGGWTKYGIDLLYRVARGNDTVALMKTAMLFRSNETGQLEAPTALFKSKVES